MRITYTSRFERAYKKLPIIIQDLAEQKEDIFRRNPHDSRLKTHKLEGRLKEFWAFWVNYGYRIIFEFGKNDEIIFHRIGDHKIYERPII